MASATLVPVSPLLERDALLASLVAIRAEVDAGRGRLVLLAGEAGVGKTTLLRRFCEEEARVFWGSCDPLFTPRPLGPLLDVADQTGGELGRVLEAGGGPHEIVLALLDAVRDGAPAILVIEDVHWADEATYDVLRLLARRVEGARLLVVATFRDEEVERTHPLRVVIGELATTSTVERLSVEPLSEAAVARLAKPMGVDAAELFRQTGGNPFFVTEVLAAGGSSIPRTVRDAVLARAARLDPRARALLDTVAIAPPSVELQLLEELAGGEAEELDDCLSSGMLVWRAGALEFRHELARLAIEDSLDPRRRLALHRKALSALAVPDGREPDVARLAHHAEAAGDAEAVLRYAPAAAERASALRAHREAAAQYKRALRFADRLAPDARAELLERAADACYLTDRCGDAIAAVEEALECYRGLGDRYKEGEALCLLSRLQMCPASVAEAAPAGERAVELLEQFPPGPALAMAYANLAAISMNAEDAERTRHWAAPAIRLAESLGDVDVRAHALNSLGTMEFLLGGSNRREAVEQSVKLALEAGLEVHVLRGYSNMAWAAARHRAHDLAERYLEAGLARCREPDFDLWRLHLLGYRAWSPARAGPLGRGIGNGAAHPPGPAELTAAPHPRDGRPRSRPGAPRRPSRGRAVRGGRRPRRAERRAPAHRARGGCPGGGGVARRQRRRGRRGDPRRSGAGNCAERKLAGGTARLLAPARGARGIRLCARRGAVRARARRRRRGSSRTLGGARMPLRVGGRARPGGGRDRASPRARRAPPPRSPSRCGSRRPAAA